MKKVFWVSFFSLVVVFVSLYIHVYVNSFIVEYGLATELYLFILKVCVIVCDIVALMAGVSIVTIIGAGWGVIGMPTKKDDGALTPLIAGMFTCLIVGVWIISLFEKVNTLLYPELVTYMSHIDLGLFLALVFCSGFIGFLYGLGNEMSEVARS